MSRFYAHLQRGGDDVKRFLAVALPTGIKFMGSADPSFANEILALYRDAGKPRPFCWRREWWDDTQSEWIREGTRGARRWFERFVGTFERWMDETGIGTFELQNEFIANTLDDTRRETEWMVEAIRLLSTLGAVGVAGNHSVWWPKMEHFAAYKPALWAIQETGGYWANHEYAWLAAHPQTGENLLYYAPHVQKHREILSAIDGMGLHVNYLITEFGWDAALTGCGYHRGFRDLSDQSVVLPWIRWYLDHLHPAVKGAAWFQTGAQGDWRAFDLVGSQIETETAALMAEAEPQATVKVWRRILGRVDMIPLEEYVKGVVPQEVYINWPMEALKAQAVWARSYVRYQMGHPKHTAQGGQVCDGPCCQAYGTYRHERSDAAVDATVGQVWHDADTHMYEFVNECGRDECPHCLGQSGHLGQVWSTRACQWGAKVMAEQGADWQTITRLYYDGEVAPVAVVGPATEPATDGLTIRQKARWWTEEALRCLEATDSARAREILEELVNPTAGLLYRPRYVED